MNLIAPKDDPTERGGPIRRTWRVFFTTSAQLLTAMTQSGTTANRPTTLLWTGRMYFDTTLGQPVWYDPSSATDWSDATGADA